MSSKTRLRPAHLIRNSFAIGITAISIAHADDRQLGSEPVNNGCNTVEQSTTTEQPTASDDKTPEAACGAGQCGTGKCGVGSCAGTSSE